MVPSKSPSMRCMRLPSTETPANPVRGARRAIASPRTPAPEARRAQALRAGAGLWRWLARACAVPCLWLCLAATHPVSAQEKVEQKPQLNAPAMVQAQAPEHAPEHAQAQRLQDRTPEATPVPQAPVQRPTGAQQDRENATEGDALSDAMRAEREQIGQQREQITADFTAREAACHRRFFMNACLRDVADARRQALAPLRARELQIDEAERLRRRDAALQRSGDKQAQAQEAAEAAQRSAAENALQRQQQAQQRSQSQSRAQEDARARAEQQRDREAEIRRRAEERSAAERQAQERLQAQQAREREAQERRRASEAARQERATRPATPPLPDPSRPGGTGAPAPFTTPAPAR